MSIHRLLRKRIRGQKELCRMVLRAFACTWTTDFLASQTVIDECNKEAEREAIILQATK